ncbi:MAG: DUF1932 domain-containing protein [Anaerolineales bacterium]|jgi:3-hydroxyisobutyrate dehydrogenase-like beta-hydroxyacid dehydrogenase
MRKINVGLMHPGQMGVSIGASARRAGHEVYWVSEGRSPDTHARARQSELIDLRTLDVLCSRVEVILSICPPHAAENVLQEVLRTDFSGIFVDANAISPQKSIRMAEACKSQDVNYVDGGIVGGPAWKPNSTFLYLAGKMAPSVADLFSEGPLETRSLGTQIGRASALKMCFAAYTKGSSALICMILAGAGSLGVREELMQLWSQDGSDFADQAENRTRRVTRKAWRFAGEMEEIANTFGAQGLPEGFHAASKQIFDRLSEFKDREELPSIEEITRSLLKSAN